MALGGCLTCIKYLMFVFNFIFWLIGCVILSVGIYVLVQPSALNMGQAVGSLKIATYILIGVGSVIMVVGFLGCCGAIRESQCMLVLFFVFLFLIFAVLVSVGIYFAINKDEFKAATIKAMEDQFKEDVLNYNSSHSKQVVDKIQQEYHCCGYKDGPADFPTGNKPTECSLYPNTRCQHEVFDKLWLLIRKNMYIVTGVALGIAFIMLLGLVFSMMLCCAIRDGM